VMLVSAYRRASGRRASGPHASWATETEQWRAPQRAAALFVRCSLRQLETIGRRDESHTVRRKGCLTFVAWGHCIDEPCNRDGVDRFGSPGRC
jgi:hypothetical protein